MTATLLGQTSDTTKAWVSLLYPVHQCPTHGSRVGASTYYSPGAFTSLSTQTKKGIRHQTLSCGCLEIKLLVQGQLAEKILQTTS